MFSSRCCDVTCPKVETWGNREKERGGRRRQKGKEKVGKGKEKAAKKTTRAQEPAEEEPVVHKTIKITV